MENELDKDLEVKDINGEEKDTPNKDGVDIQKTKEELRKELLAELEVEKQKEIDKRVTEAVKKRERKIKAEQEEKERLAKLTEEERVSELTKKAERELKEREQKVVLLEVKQSLVDILNENQLDLGFRDIINVDMIASIEDEEDRLETLKANVSNVKTIVDKLIEKGVENFKREFLKGEPPKNLNKDANLTPISDYDKARKSGDVKSMLQQKLFNNK